ncbi:MAG TPA: ABC transporter substrate-binding protein/permease [Anaeromyxobacteraceae bacterium]|nr:ABC transporter substrate-binding protein/permease [Anaeromyxobacteraceae bacterium]
MTAAWTVLAAAVALATGPSGEEPGGAPGSGGTLHAVRERGALRWGADAFGGAPYVFQDPVDPNHLIGFEVELADAIARRIGVRARPAEGAWDKLLDLLARGDFDVALNGIEVADEKRRVCLLSTPYYAAGERLTVRRGDAGAPRSLESVAGRRVGTLPGSLAQRILERAGAAVMTYDGGQNDIYDDLRLGRTDAVLLDEPIARYYGDIQPELETLPGAFGEVRYAVAIRLGDAPLKAAIDEAIAGLARDGTLRGIYERWGIWNAATAALLGDAAPAPRAGVAERWEAWRAAVGRPPSAWERLTRRYPATFWLFARGAAFTLLLSLASMALAVAVGAVVAAARRYGSAPVRWLALGYVEIVRGTPLLVQLIMIYFGLPELGVKLDPFVAGWLALGLNYAAAEAENYRAGLESVPVAQGEVAATLGLSRWQTLRHVIAPQAIRISLPPMTNDVIALLKDSSLVSIVTLTELTKTYSNLAASMRDHLGLGAVVAAWYLVLGLPLARAGRAVERRLGRHLRRAAT